MDSTGYIALTRQSGLMREMQVVANNIANAATPGYKARDIDFRGALEAKLAQGRMQAAGGDTAMASGEDAHTLYRIPTMPSLAGGTVELNREQLAFAENAVAYSATLSFVQGKVNVLTRALKVE